MVDVGNHSVSESRTTCTEFCQQLGLACSGGFSENPFDVCRTDMPVSCDSVVGPDSGLGCDCIDAWALDAPTGMFTSGGEGQSGGESPGF
jgi:hypothetical protein